MAAHSPDRPDLAERYAEEIRALAAARLRVACWLAITLVPVFVALDWVLYSEVIGLFAIVRSVMVGINLVALLALDTRAGRRHIVPLSLVEFLQIGFGIVLMTALGGGASSPYYNGVNLVMFAAAVLMPWELPISITCCTVLVVAYVLSCVVWTGVADAHVFIGNLFFLSSTALITVVSHGVAAGARRREFLQRVALEEAGLHRDHFLANVTHELRTPLAAILGFCEMLSDYTPDATETQRGWLGRIRENALTLLRLIVQLLDFSKIEAGALELVQERVHIHAIVAKVALGDTTSAKEAPEVDAAGDGVRDAAGGVRELLRGVGWLLCVHQSLPTREVGLRGWQRLSRRSAAERESHQESEDARKLHGANPTLAECGPPKAVFCGRPQRVICR